jgi:hypothetical protein
MVHNEIGEYPMDKKPIEVWESDSGWSIEVYSREPRDVEYVPIIVPEDDGSYHYFTIAARANGYKLVETVTTA